MPASPFANHVHVRVAGGFQNLPVALGRDPRRKAVIRNHVSTFGEDGNSVDDEFEALAPLIGDAAEFDEAQSGLHLGVGGDTFTEADSCREVVAVLSTIAQGIPKSW